MSSLPLDSHHTVMSWSIGEGGRGIFLSPLGLSIFGMIGKVSRDSGARSHGCLTALLLK